VRCVSEPRQVHSATWFYIETKHGREGIISGKGSTYSLGAPTDMDVWTSVEYAEIMYENGIVDASGHSADGKYWRMRSIFGAASQYYGQSRETAEQLDCLLGALGIVLAQSTTTPLPKFEDYSVNEIFDHTPHPPILTTPQQRRFRTRIREGVEKGRGVWINVYQRRVDQGAA
jgi:hypothetical protein